jgi:DNA helicase-2/ATP-dependent DNA helicase PcrA
VENIINQLNPSQKEAVINFKGPSLVIAGAGSGKTRVLTYRIAYMLSQGIPPQGILALTFTNKAASEMKERIASLVGLGIASKLWMGTFHSIFARILRYEAESLGYPSNFTIYDTIDSRNLIKTLLKELNLDEKIYKPAEVFSRISGAKNNLITPDGYAANSGIRAADAASRKPMISDIYKRYASRCKRGGAMDFDDLLMNTNILFRDFPDVLDKYMERFTHILVDEYQDTNYSQYLIIKKLAQQHRNICVVGDDAQSIYSFRGARIENILSFQNDYDDARTYKLERNYRSTQNIVEAANSIISTKKDQLKKRD